MTDSSDNGVQRLVGAIRDILEPLVQGVDEEAVRRDILQAVGLDPAQGTQPLNVPTTAIASIDAYRQQASTDADLKAFLSVMQDFTQIVQALTDLIRSAAATDANTPPGFIVEEAVSFYFNAIAVGAVRLRAPGVYIAAKALQLVEEQSLRFGGITQLLFRTDEYLTRLVGSARKLETEQDAQRVSDVALFAGGILLQHFLTGGELIYGYDPGPGSTSPNADVASNRTLTMRFTGTTKDLSGNTVKGSLVVTAVFLPTDHGGPGLVLRVQGDGSVDLPLTPNVSLKITAESPDVIFYFGKGAPQFPTSTGASLSARLEYRDLTLVTAGAAGTSSPESGTSENWMVAALPTAFGRVATGEVVSLVDLAAPTETITITGPIAAGSTSVTVIRGAQSTTPVAHAATARFTVGSTLWGDPAGIHLRIGKIGVEGRASTDDYEFKADIKESAFILATRSADGFLRKVLDAVAPDGKLQTTFSFEIGYSRKRGFFVGGGAGFMTAIPLHETIGPLALDTLVVGLAIGDRAGRQPGIKLEGSLSFGLDLGVLQASVDRIGLAGMVAFDENRELTFAFKPPNGVGLLIDAGAVRGGGFLLFDPDRGEYAGALELDIAGIVTVKAIGLITTKLPDGTPGFSLLVIMTLELGTPLGPFGPGIFIIGLGGLLGLNRTVRLEPLAQGVRTGSVDRILFPTNIVANAARIISDLRTIFPPQTGTFLIGPMVKLGWGKPILVTLSLGVVIQIPPGNVVILGVLRVLLPDEKAAKLKLQVAFVGAIEFDKKRAWFYATLFDSRVLLLTIEGSLGVLVGWGENTEFVISVGGFHPQFRPPPLPFPIPDRLAINILNQDAARVRVTAYLAVTSNTVQFGGKAEVFFGFDSVSIEGHLAFDALFQFSPFHFIVEFSTSVSLKAFGAGLFCVRLRGSLEGPTPWRIVGAASVSILFFHVSVDFEITRGEGADTTLSVTSGMPLLAAEYDKETNWKAELPGGTGLMVSLRQLEAAQNEVVLHPLGQLRVSQRAVPLEITVDRIGNQRVSDANLFRLKVDGGDLTKRHDSSELFAIGQFQDLPDAAKLSLPAFQPEPGGVVLAASGQQRRSSRMVKRRVRHELIIIDTNFKRFVRPFFGFWRSLFTHFGRGNAVALSELSYRRQREMQPYQERIVVRDGGFTVANVADNIPFTGQARSFGSEAQAREYLSQQLAADRTLAGKLHVIPRYEVNEAA